MSSITITNFPENLESDYQSSLAKEKLRVAKQTCWLCIVLYSAFGILDIWAIPSALYATWAIRATVATLTLGVIGLAAWYPDRLVSHYAAITASIYTVWGLGIEAMIFLSQPADLAWSVYYAGLILTSMALYAWTFLRPVSAALIGAFVIGVYVFIAVWIQGMARDGQWPVLLANCYFLVSSNIIGLYSLNSRERFSRQAYLLQHALGRNLEMTDEAKRQSDYLAEHDPLTGIPNRLQFVRVTNEMIALARERADNVAVLFIDLDDFKPVNDTHGHPVGDLVLQIIAKRIRSCVRSSDIIARIGGDEFAVGLELSSNNLELVSQIGRNIVDVISAPVADNGKELCVTASIGGAVFPFHATDADSLLSIADRQMYEVKRSGKMSISVAPLPTDLQKYQGIIAESSST